MKILHRKDEKSNIKFTFFMMQNIDFDSSTHKRFWISEYSKIMIPYPPLGVQKVIVDEIESYQKVIDGARQVVENYKPIIHIDPDWTMAKLGEVCHFKRGPFGGSLKKEIFVKTGFKVYEQKNAINNDFALGRYFITHNKFEEMKNFSIAQDDLIISCSGTMGKIAIVPVKFEPGIINQALLKLTCVQEKISPKYLKLLLETDLIQGKYFTNTQGAAIKNVASVKILKEIKIPLPSIKIQKIIVDEIQSEIDIIDANKALIERFEAKIADRIRRVWEEG